MRRLLLALGGVVVAAALFLQFRRPGPPEAAVARVRWATLVQQLTTNGRVEALDTHAVHVRVASQVVRVEVAEGDSVRAGQLLAVVDNTAAREALGRAEAQLEIARADRGVAERGGTAAELAELDASIARARLEQDLARNEAAALERLVQKQAAPRLELEQQQQRLRKAEAELAALERKRSSFLGPEDRQRIEARIRDAETAVAQAASALKLTEIRSPAEGTLFELTLRPGAFYGAGAPAARVGRLDLVRVRVLVDEPELGRVAVGQPVRITWDAAPGRSWLGRVERLPASIQAAGTRSVGEVLCTLENPGRRLIPNVTVNVEIRTGSAENALTIPRETIVREGEQTSVLLVDAAGLVARRAVRLGLQDPTRVQVLDGLAENDLVLLPGERRIAPGERVQAKASS